MLSNTRGWCLVAVSIAAWLFAARATAQSELRYRSGQNVVPTFDGFEPNDDGTYTLWFGYLNRNYEEVMDVPIGPDNSFEPGPADRGQPTHFVTRRNKSMFALKVSGDIAKQKLTWRLTTHGKTEIAVANLLPSSQITRRTSTLSGAADGTPNTPPQVKVLGTPVTVTLPAKAKLAVSITDDGLGLPPQWRATPGADKPVLKVRWFKYRGPGKVTFSPQISREVSGAVAVTEASFSEPGIYIVHARVDDGSSDATVTPFVQSAGEYCCWTNVDVAVTVNPVRSAAR